MASAPPSLNINPTHGALYSYSPLAPRRLNSQVQQGLVRKKMCFGPIRVLKALVTMTHYLRQIRSRGRFING